MQEKRVKREIPSLIDHDFMYVVDSHKKEFDTPTHQHDNFELNFVAGASGCRRIVGDSSEMVGNLDLLLITNPYLEHIWERHECKSDDIHEITILFHIDFESQNSLFQTNPYKSIYYMLTRAKRGLAFPHEAIMQVHHRIIRLSSIEDKFLAVQELLSIFYDLSKYEDAHELASSAFANVEVNSNSRRVLKVKNYIKAHINDNLNLEILANLVGMTPTAFSRYFKVHTGNNLSDYIVDVRLGVAARKLVDTTDSVSEICYCCGFNTLSNFNRLFRKRKGCNPTEFREKYQKTKGIV